MAANGSPRKHAKPPIRTPRGPTNSMKNIWNMSDKQIWKEGITAGSIVTAVAVAAGIYTEHALIAAAIGGAFLATMSAFGLTAKKLREIEKEVKQQ